MDGVQCFTSYFFHVICTYFFHSAQFELVIYLNTKCNIRWNSFFRCQIPNADKGENIFFFKGKSIGNLIMQSVAKGTFVTLPSSPQWILTPFMYILGPSSPEKKKTSWVFCCGSSGGTEPPPSLTPFQVYFTWSVYPFH